MPKVTWAKPDAGPRYRELRLASFQTGSIDSAISRTGSSSRSYNRVVKRSRLVPLAVFSVCAASLVFGAETPSDRDNAAARIYWAFVPPARVDTPTASSPWVRNPLDSFIWEGLQANELFPSAEAAKERLLRRVCLDLTGLPPSPEQVSSFLSDQSPDAYERLVAALLASPHYGERWAQKWLDVVRFADTDGFERDGFREHGWRYRDYVVESFNNDKPYDQFLREQIAGDELYPGNQEALVATGFHGAGPRHVVGGNQDKEESRQEVLTEMALGVGQALLGLTVQCARCHDHKFDPISQRDYYRLEAFFGGTDLEDVTTAGENEIEASRQAMSAHEDRLKPIKDRLAEIEAPYKQTVEDRKRAALEPPHAAALAIPEAERTAEQERLAKEAESQIKPVWYEFLPLMSDDVKKRRAALRKELHALELRKPEPPAAAFAVSNLEDAPKTHVLQGGDYRRKGEPVEPGFPEVVGPLGFEIPADGKGRRSALARWLTHPKNPLVARVMANRIWEFRMGQGLMSDPNNFGLLGGMPSHPGLLDQLANRFVGDGWSVKAIDRLVVLSSAYRQSAAIDSQRAATDPDNRWYGRAQRRRLSGEVIRDSALAASGRLNRSLTGKPVRIPIEREVYDLIFTEAEPDNLWPVTPNRFEHDRRSLYLLNKRTVRLPFLANFDQPDTMTSCSVRQTSTHALQSLSLLNSDFMQEQAIALAERVLRRCVESNSSCVVEEAFRLTLSRRPSSDERRLAENFLASGPESLRDFSLALLNRNEFVYRP